MEKLTNDHYMVPITDIKNKRIEEVQIGGLSIYKPEIKLYADQIIIKNKFIGRRIPRVKISYMIYYPKDYTLYIQLLKS